MSVCDDELEDKEDAHCERHKMIGKNVVATKEEIGDRRENGT